METKSPMSKNIGFISTRFWGTDGVTLEAGKWVEVFENSGHQCFWFAGKLDRDPSKSLLVPEAHFQNNENVRIDKQVFGKKVRSPEVTELIHQMRMRLKIQLHHFIKQFDLDLLIAENVLSIPMHIPLALALTETIAETQIPTIAHHHDFTWERPRFSLNCVNEYIRMAFPPNLPCIEHVVINSTAQEELALRTGISSKIIPNVLDFETPPIVNHDKVKAFRYSIGLKEKDIMILQPTRIVPRKGIEHAIALVKGLDDPRCKLVISHEAGDEGLEYLEWLSEYAKEQKVDMRLVETKLADPFNKTIDDEKLFSLWDIYPSVDFVTYPSLCEGFGNALLEAIYFKKPLLINRYSTYIKDIEPLGFDLAVMDGFLTQETIQQVRQILFSAKVKKDIGNKNYELAVKNFSYSNLRKKLDFILQDILNQDTSVLKPSPVVPDNIIYFPNSNTAANAPSLPKQKKRKFSSFLKLSNFSLKFF